ncbi:MAG: ribonuclease Y [Planctomycetes bacterium SCN 63-9]|nr:MAG: ribonuclease Y [Planctomycetes bacterium SCN 63-9]
MQDSTLGGFVGLFLGLLGGFLGYSLILKMRAQSAASQAEQILNDARDEASALFKRGEIESKEENLRRREQADLEIEGLRKELREQERRLEKRADLLDQQLDLINERERETETTRKALADQKEEMLQVRREAEQYRAEQRELMVKIGRLTPDEAREHLLHELKGELTDEFGELILKHEAVYREESQRKAREILSLAIQRYAAPHTAEITVSTVDIPNDEMKGRIIGREGRNIRAFEKATGIDLIVDDTPGIVVVTGFDSVRREIAKLSLEKLIQDGRIHPTRIEEIVKETQEEMDRHIQKLGEQASQEAGVENLHEKLLPYLGRLKFRTSYSQNVLRHSLEVAFLTGIMAEELGLDGALGRRCGLLHDIGKAADHEMEGGHPAVGGVLLKRYGEGPDVVHAAEGHHDDLRVDRAYTVLVAAADAISASRPGARRETLEKYVRRLEELEALVLGFPGVEQAYAVQAGREVRVLVDSSQLDDAASSRVCRDIAQAIQSQLNYPGEVKVTVVRESRTVEFAR